jgi:hypothetical protein
MAVRTGFEAGFIVTVKMLTSIMLKIKIDLFLKNY